MKKNGKEEEGKIKTRTENVGLRKKRHHTEFEQTGSIKQSLNVWKNNEIRKEVNDLLKKCKFQDR